MDYGNYVWANDGSGTFSSAGQLLGDGGNLSVTLGDIDGDDDPDAIIGGSDYFNRPTKVYFNQSYRAGVENSGRPPHGLGLHPNLPNPFTTTTYITYSVDAPGSVWLEVYDVEGRVVSTLADGFHAAGVHIAKFDAAGLASGIYFCRLADTGGRSLSRKLTLIH
jgi:hypothetical protein